MAGRSASSSAPEVSVIVPVCNVEDYVGECLEGLSAQTLQNMEILLVNDGSSDNSPQIMAEAASRDPRMRVIDKPNGGYGSAVNAGLSQARGRYVGIVEPDDWVDIHMFEDLLEDARLEDGGWADVVKGSYWNYYDFPDQEPFIEAPNLMNCMPKKPFCSTAKEQFEVFFHHPSIWSAIYRREFLEEHGIRMHEVPGGGWVDNPFFFETLLQAKTFVWEPAAYYYYRQTNPNSSSNLKNFHLPYDRLRDLRELYKRLNVTDPQLIACLYARHFFYTDSVIGEWGFPEADPELNGLIHEAMAALDPKILYGGYRGITKEYLAYYESVMGDPAKGLGAHAKATSPLLASVVVPACNDRDVLAATLRDLAAQTLDAIEVIVVDCASDDASPRIASAFADKDGRFSCLHVDEQSYAVGIEAGLAQAKASALTVVLPGQAVPKQHLEQAVKALDGGADLSISLGEGDRCFSPIDGDAGSGVFRSQGRNAELLLCAAENVSGCVFRADFVREASLHLRADDDEAQVFLLEAVHAADRVALRQEEDAPSPRVVKRSFAKVSDETDLDLYESHRRVWDELYEVAEGLGEDALRAARCLIVRHMIDDVHLFSCTDHAEEIFDDLRQSYQERYGISLAPRSSYCNQDSFHSLERAMSASYMASLQHEARNARGENRALRERCESIKGSGSYRLGNAIVRAGRKVLPTSLYRKLKS